MFQFSPGSFHYTIYKEAFLSALRLNYEHLKITMPCHISIHPHVYLGVYMNKYGALTRRTALLCSCSIGVFSPLR